MTKQPFIVSALGWMLIASTSLKGQVVNQTSFEDHPAAREYVRQSWTDDGFTARWVDGFDQSRVVVDDQYAFSGSKSIRVKYPAGNYGTQRTGAQAPLTLPPQSQYYSSYSLRFSDDFDWGGTNEGGKLPGLAGGSNCSGCVDCDGTNGFTARLMWRPDGEAVLYLYHMDKTATCGQNIPLKDKAGQNIHFQKGRWYTVTQRVKINSGNDSNGEVEMWIDGEHALLHTGVRFVNNGGMVDNFYFSTFHGGNDSSWAPDRDSYIWFDDVKIGKRFSDVYEAPRPPSPAPEGLPVSRITASSDDGNVPANTYDNDLNTRWAAKGKGAWIMHELQAGYYVQSVDIAFYKGKQRRAYFDIAVSEDGSTWTDVFSGTSGGSSAGLERFDVADRNARYVRITGQGNTASSPHESQWNSMTEIQINGTSTSPGNALPVSSARASSHDGNVPANTYDGNLSTRWSAKGEGEWIVHALDDVYHVQSVDIAFYQGDQRQAYFDIELSDEGSTWTKVFSGTSTGRSTGLQSFDFIDRDARYVRVVGRGNSSSAPDASLWNSFTEIQARGSALLSTELRAAEGPAGEPLLYPNPAPEGTAEVTVKEAATGSSVTILDFLGNEVDRQHLSGVHPRITTAGLRQGLYVVLIERQGNVVRARLWID